MVNFFIYLTFLTGLITTTVLAESVTAQKSRSCLNSNISDKYQALLLIPDLVSDLHVWNDVAKILSKNYQVHSWSIAGFGAIPASKKADDIFQKIQIESFIEQQS